MSFLEVAGALLLVAIVAGVLAVLALPIMLAMALLSAVVKITLFTVLAPIRLLGWMIGAGLAGIGFLLKGFLLTGTAALLLLLGLLPLVPFLLLGILIYLLVRSSRHDTTPVAGA